MRSDKKGQLNKNMRGFTLVELIVVLVIVAILAAVAVPTFIAFIDMGREKEYRNNAEKCLSSTRAALNEIYSDAGNSFSPGKRSSVRDLADPEKKSTEFIVWTQNPLDSKSVRAVPDYIASYTIEKALYEEAGYYFAFDSQKWEKFEGAKAKENALKFLSADNSKVIYMWPYKQDVAYFPTMGDEDYYGEDDSDTIKVVNLMLDAGAMNYVYFSSKGGNENLGLKEIKVIFWKENNNIKSTWTVSNGNNYFTLDDSTELELHTERYSLNGWKPVEKDGQLISGVSTKSGFEAIRDYIYSSEEKGKIYSFQLLVDDNGEFAFDDDVYISNSAFSDVLAKATENITVVSRKTLTDYENEKKVPPEWVRIDDQSVKDGYIFAHCEGNTFYWWTNSTKNVYMPSDCSKLFKGKTKVENFDFGSFNFEKVTNMSEMFADNATLKSVTGIGSTGSVTNVHRMFAGCSGLTSADISNISGNISSLDSMFEGCKSISSIDFSSGFNTSSVSSFENMFKGCESATAIDISELNLSSAASLNSMFENCKSVSSLDVSSWNLTSAKTMNSTFKGCNSLATLDSANIRTSRKLEDLKETFSGCYRLSSIDLSGINAGGVKSTEKLFSMEEWKNDSDFLSNNSLKTITFKAGFDTYNTENMSGMFAYCTKLTTINGLENLRTDNVTDMSYMFSHTNSVKELKLTSFDTSKVTNCVGMFDYEIKNNSLTRVKASSKFVFSPAVQNQVVFSTDSTYNKLKGSRNTTSATVKSKDQTGFNTAKYARVDGQDGVIGYFYEDYKKVTVKEDKFQSLFENEVTTKVIHVETSQYTLSEVQYLPGVVDIRDADAGKSYYVFAWRDGTVVKWWSNAEAVYLPSDCSDMFSDNRYNGLKTFDFSGFDISKVTTMANMFKDKTNLTSVTFGTMFYTDKLTTTTDMFTGCINLNTTTLDYYDTFKKE